MRSLIILTLCLGICFAQRRRAEEGKGPCKRETGLFHHEEYCDKYYDCYKNDYVVRDCPNGLMFAGRRRGVNSNCDYPHNIKCGKRTKKNPPLGNAPCNYLYSIVEHETSCTKYYSCWNGTAITETCINGLLWNQKVFSCDWASRVSGCQTHPLCEGNFNQLIDYPSKTPECLKYVQCIGGFPRVQRCPAGLAWKSDQKSCVHYIDVPECSEFFTTTPAPIDEYESEEEAPPSRRNRVRNPSPPRRQNIGNAQPPRRQSIPNPQQPRRPIDNAQPTRF